MKQFLTNRWLHTILLLALLGGALYLRVQDGVWIKSFSYRAFDMFNELHPREPTDQAVIVDIDEASLRPDRLGQWPWPRTTVAKLVEGLSAMGAKAIVFDMVFAEPDRTSPETFLRHLPADALSATTAGEVAALSAHDQILAEAFKNSRRVVTGFVLTNSQTVIEKKPRIPRSISFLGKASDMKQSLLQVDKTVSTLPLLEDAATGNGSFTVLPEVDGIIRRVPLILGYKGFNAQAGDAYPLLSLEGLRVAMTNDESLMVRAVPEKNKTALSPNFEIKVGKTMVPVDDDGKFYVYYAKARPQSYISAYKVIDGSVNPAAIKDKIVLVGTSAEGLKDIRSTPLDLFVPGVEVHLNVIEQVLQQKFLSRPAIMLGVEVLFILAVGLSIIIFAPFINAVLLSLFTLTLIASIAFTSLHLYDTQGILLDPVYPSLTVFLISIIAALLNYVRVESERRAVKQAFGLYISPDYMKELTANPDQLRLGGEIRDISVMFTDIRGFTSISEQLKPDELIQLMNDFLTPMSDLVMSNRGTIDKYMGDAMMAFWNAPLDDPDHARNACIAALSMNKALEPINAQLEALAAREGRVPLLLKAGIGINSGPGAVGNMGSRQRFAYSVLGDTVNLASRLESQTKAYGVDILIGEGTVEQVRDFALLELDLIRVKGKTQPVRIYTLLGGHEEAKEAEFHTLRLVHDEMLALYRNGDFKQAIELISDCLAHAPASIKGYYTMMQERMTEMQKTPPGSSWDGVFVATSK